MQKEALLQDKITVNDTPEILISNNTSKIDTSLECTSLFETHFPFFEHIPVTSFLEKQSNIPSEEDYLLAIVDACREFEDIYQEWIFSQNDKDALIKLKTLFRHLDF